VSSNRVEVPQRNGAEVRVGVGVVLHDLLNHRLGLTIGVQRLDAVSLLATRVLAINTGTR
jgi:hypothetical protein